MGLAMARNLQRHVASKKALNMIYSNRTMSRGDALKSLGAIPEPDFAKVVDQSNVIFTMVSNDKVHTSLLNSVLSKSSSLKDKIFVDCSTIHPDTVDASVARLAEKDAQFLSAPVFGGKPIAEDGKLVFALGGPEKAAEVVRPLIQDVMGRRVIDCGPEARRAALLKIAGFVPLPLRCIGG